MTPAAAPAAERLTDAQIWRIAEAIHQGEMAEARLVERKADSPLILGFARHVDGIHTSALSAERDAASRLSVQPSTSLLADRETQRVQGDLALLDGLSGWRFDRTYIAKETQDLEELLAMVDRDLLPQARGAELRRELSTLRASIAEQLDEIRRIRQALDTHEHASGLE